MDFLKNLVTRTRNMGAMPGAHPQPDIESSLASPGPGPGSTVPDMPGQHRSSVFMPGHHQSSLIVPSDKLNTYRLLVGISTDHTLAHLLAGRTAPNLGIYTRVIRSEAQAKRSYKFYSVLINVCLGLQIIVAAALTAMGAANTSHGAITTFGAINTVIAGFLTFLKGSSLPGRFKYYHDQWKKLREFIEQRERALARPDNDIDVHETVSHIEAMYDDIRADIEASVPEAFSSATKRRDIVSSAINSSSVNSQMHASTEKHNYLSKLKELETKYGDTARHMVSEAMHLGKEPHAAAEAVTEKAKGVAVEAEHHQQAASSAVREVEELAKEKFASITHLKEPDKDSE